MLRVKDFPFFRFPFFRFLFFRFLFFRFLSFLHPYFVPLPCAYKADDADNDEKINQQNVASFSVTSIIRELISPSLVQSASWRIRNCLSYYSKILRGFI